MAKSLLLIGDMVVDDSWVVGEYLSSQFALLLTQKPAAATSELIEFKYGGCNSSTTWINKYFR